MQTHGDSADKALITACKEGADPDVAVCLVKELGADIHAENKNSRTPLRIASEKGHHQLIRVLLELGAKLQGNALLNSAQNGHHLAVRLLVRELGADVGFRITFGQTHSTSPSSMAIPR